MTLALFVLAYLLIGFVWWVIFLLVLRDSRDTAISFSLFVLFWPLVCGAFAVLHGLQWIEQFAEWIVARRPTSEDR